MSILRKIHGVPSSPYVRKIRVMMAEKGLDYDLVPVFPFGAGKEFRKLSPLGKIPVLEEDGYVLPDSSAIAEYLEAIDKKVDQIIRTQINQDHWDSDKGQKLMQMLPRKRIGTPADLDSVLLMLVADESQFINGAAITADDGLSVT